MSPQPQLPREPPIQYKAPNVIIIDKEDLKNREMEMENTGNSKPTFKLSRTPETMIQLMEGLPTDASDDNDEVSNNGKHNG